MSLPGKELVRYHSIHKYRRLLTKLAAGSLNELLGDHEGALFAYEQALRHNQWSTQTLNAISCILRTKEKYPEAMEYLKNILKVEPANGEAWGNLGKIQAYLLLVLSSQSKAIVTS